MSFFKAHTAVLVEMAHASLAAENCFVPLSFGFSIAAVGAVLTLPAIQLVNEVGLSIWGFLSQWHLLSKVDHQY